jgi:hypothetical protein
VKKTLHSALFMLLLCGCAPIGPSEPPLPAADRLGRWKQDIDYLQLNYSKLQIEPWVKISQSVFDTSLVQLTQGLPQLEDWQIQLQLTKIMNGFENAHIRLRFKADQFQYLPVSFRWFDDMLYVSNSDQKWSELIGKQVESINGVSASDVGKRISPYVTFENRPGYLAYSPGIMRNLGVLAAAGVAPLGSSITIKLLAPDKTQSEVILPPVQLSEPKWVNPLTENQSPPLYLQQQDKNFWFTYTKNTAYFKYNSCQDPTGTLNTNIRAFLDQIQNNPPEQIVIDLRLNTGGNSALLRPLINGLGSHPLMKAQKVFVLSDRFTASSAFRNLMELRELGALHVGEAASQRPRYTGNINTFKLPNSQLEVVYSTQITTLGSGEATTVEPNIGVTTSANAYFDRQDPVLATVMRSADLPKP